MTSQTLFQVADRPVWASIYAALILVGLLGTSTGNAHCKRQHDPALHGGVCPHDDSGGGSGENQITCDSAYYGKDPGDSPTYCTKLNNPNEHCMLDVPQDGTPGLAMSEHCQIIKTLVLPEPLRLLSGGGTYAMYLGDEEGNWDPLGGDAGITNDTGPQGETARIAGMTIVGRAGAVTGCGGGGVSTAVRLNPDIDRVDEYGNDVGPTLPRMAAADLIIDTDDTATRFCNAVEYVGTDGDIVTPYFAGGVGGVTVMADAFEQYGILLKNLNTTDNVTGDYDVAVVGDNIVQYSSEGEAAIRLENVERANVTDNTVAAPSGGVGIEIVRSGTVDADASLEAPSLLLDYRESRPVNLERNDASITNGHTGFLIDRSRIDRNRGNSVIGNGGGKSYRWLNRQTNDDGMETLEFPIKGKHVNTCNSTLIEAAEDDC